MAGAPGCRAPGSSPTSATAGRVVALRADLDALPVEDTTDDPWTSTVPGVAHACGHDVHTTALLGAGLALAEAHAAGCCAGRVRLLFQPAEEVMPGGALHLMEPRRPRRRRRGSSACTATPASTSARSGCAIGPAHQRRRPRSRSASRAPAATPRART